MSGMRSTLPTVAEKPLVTAIITTYQRDARYIQEAIDSALSQTYPNIEVIVVDDNGYDSVYSSDVERLCSSYDGIKYIHNETNRGAQFSRNIGIMASSGDYIAFLDDDDVWAPEKIEKQIMLFDRPEVGMVYCDGYSFTDGNREELRPFRDASLFGQPINYKLELFNDYIGSTSQAVVRRDCFADVGLFDTEMPARQDYEMWLRISRQYSIVGAPEKLLFYRMHSGERISTNFDKIYRSYGLILQKYRKEYNQNRYAKSKLILRLFATARKMRRPLLALSRLIWAFFVCPSCVYDVIRRNLRGQSFSAYYSTEKLQKILHL